MMPRQRTKNSREKAAFNYCAPLTNNYAQIAIAFLLIGVRPASLFAAP
jgi:hypothetical protein